MEKRFSNIKKNLGVVPVVIATGLGDYLGRLIIKAVDEIFSEDQVNHKSIEKGGDS